MKKFLAILFIVFINFLPTVYAQNSIKRYTIAEIKVEGTKSLQTPPIIRTTGLYVGQEITVPGPEITAAIEKLWEQGLFADAKISASKIEGDNIYLLVSIKERSRLNSLRYEGIKKSEQNDLNDLLDFKTHMQITENQKDNAEKKIKAYYDDKGYKNAEIAIKEVVDTTAFNSSNITISIKKNSRIKINDIVFHGNEAIKAGKLHRAMKNTKRKRWYVLKRSKYIEKNYEKDKKNIIEKYKKLGYRDAVIKTDTIYSFDSTMLNIEMTIDEGKKYYFGNISWLGNSVYSTDILNKILAINKGDVYDESRLQEKIYGLEGVSSIYLDNGYLFFNADPVELGTNSDSIDIQIRIYEGQQAVINNITVAGNTKTNDHVIYRELRTKPGELFSRSDIIRTQRELAMLGYFDAENMQVNPQPNPMDGTVDIEYVLQEKSTDQIELSFGWSGSYLLGSVRLVLNNFSLRNTLKKEYWRPIPSGDGQQLSIGVSANTRYYQYYNFSFTEPWFGGKKPNALTISAYYSVRANGYARSSEYYGNWRTVGASVGLERDLKIPDDYFSLYNDISIKRYKLNNYNLYLPTSLPDSLTARCLTLGTTIARSSIDQPLYPRRGSSFALRLELTPPFSLFRDDADDENLPDEERYKWIEYHKWTFKSKMYTQIIGDLVLETRIDFGYVGHYNKNFKTPFERFDIGGDGLSNVYYYGTDFVPMRGYDASALNPESDGGAFLYDKFSLELRYPLALKQETTIYVLAFAEAANAWMDIADYNPFDVKRSAGGGIRLFIPMMGLLGFDLGYGFDKINGKSNEVRGWQPTFVLGQQF
ncbi:MAG: outer membrane protein assembly factor BamA [Bacteroidales bacterium]|nr:outer membrane protein assembly factor BamA [Bacteroidales bacterium]